jgi:excisionase family DNA binding protein
MSIISLVLFTVGVGLILMGRVRLGELDAEGPPVRAAGLVLMTPVIAMLLLGIIAGALTRSDPAGLIGLLEVVSWIAAVTVAYYLLVQKSGMRIDLTQIKLENLTNIQQLRQSNPLQRPPAPSVMTVAQAARYLGMSEKAVLEAIQEGRLSATKTMQGYTIARFVLDEYRDSLNKP